jgi:regulator of replication initiation timing
MNNAKDIAEKILNQKYVNQLEVTYLDVNTLARNYLDTINELETDNTYIPMLEKRMIELNNSNQELKSEITKLNGEVAQLKVNYDYEYKKAVDYFNKGLALESEITKLSEANTKFKEENEDLNFYKKQYQSIAGKANLKHLVESNEALRAENENLNVTLSEHSTDIDSLRKSITYLRSENIRIMDELVYEKGSKENALNNLSASIHDVNVKAGWWSDLATGEPLDRNVGELLCLVHSEVSEALEAYRKNLQDDKLPHRTGFEVELVDAIIRIFDIAGKFRLDLDGALQDKLNYNAQRADHKPEARRSQNGKKF